MPKGKRRGGSARFMSELHGLTNNGEHLVKVLGKGRIRILGEPLRRQTLRRNANGCRTVDVCRQAQKEMGHGLQRRDAVAKRHARFHVEHVEADVLNCNCHA